MLCFVSIYGSDDGMGGGVARERAQAGPRVLGEEAGGEEGESEGHAPTLPFSTSAETAHQPSVSRFITEGDRLPGVI